MVESQVAMQRLHSAEEKFRLMVESVSDQAIFMVNLDGTVASWNVGAERLKGYKADEIIGSHISRFYLREEVAAGKPLQEIERALLKGKNEVESWCVRKDGSRFWAHVALTAFRDEAGQIIGLAQVTRDLTERTETEERLRASEEQFRRLVSGVEEYAIFMLDAHGQVATWNLGGERIKGYTAEEILGASYERFFRPEDRANGRPGRLLAEARLLGHVRDQGPRLRKDGSVFMADAVITAIHDSEGKLRGFSKVTRDITDQIRNRELEAAKIAAEQANAAKDEFLAVLSHELRTPLTPVLAAASHLEDRMVDLPLDVREEVRMIRRNVQLEAQLIDDLLDLTRITRGKLELRREPVDLNAVINDVLQICGENIATKELTISSQLRASEHWISADPVRIRQIFWNVITNAVKFSPPKGTIYIRSANDNARQIQVEIEDEGIGIGAEHLDRIFEAFEQAGGGRRFGGLGLGLAITKNLVLLHRGRITARSRGLGQGATFELTFAHVSASNPGLSTAPRSSPNGEKPLRILLVEDHDDTRRILGKLLQRQHHEVAMAADIEGALKHLDRGVFDVLVSDIGLSGDNGYEMLRLARERQPLKGIALSGFGMEDDVRRSKEAGFDFHLTKPVDFKDLQEALSQLSQS